MISLIKGKKMSNHQSNCTKTNENNEDNNNNYNNNKNNKLNKYVDDWFISYKDVYYNSN